MRKALLIGVREYYGGGYDGGIGPAVQADMKAMRGLLNELNVQVTQELGGEASARISQSEIRSTIAIFILDATDRDDLIVYFSGHGRQFAGVTYLVPSEANARLPNQESYLVPVAFDLEIAESKARSLTFIIDACRDGTPSAGHSNPPRSERIVSFLYATKPRHLARSIGGTEAISVFTKALQDVLPSLSSNIRLDGAEKRIQARIDEICQLEQLPKQEIDVVSNVDKDRAPFPLFQTPIRTSAQDTWSKLLRLSEPELLGSLSEGATPERHSLASVLAAADRMDHEASLAPLADRVARNEAVSEWIEPGLAARLAKSLVLVTNIALDTDLEKLLFVGTAAAAEASIRAAEYSMLRSSAISTSVDAILAAEPVTRHSIQQNTQHAQSLKRWVVHLAATRECVLGRQGNLRSKVAEIVRSVLPELAIHDFKRLSLYLADCIRAAFDSSVHIDDLHPSVLEVDSNAESHIVDGRKIAVTLRLAWLLALDTRLFRPSFGIHLLQDGDDARPIAEVLETIGLARWRAVGNILDLNFWSNESAALDLALREAVEDINDLLLVHRHKPSAVLFSTRLPLAAAASRLQPAPDSFQLPHIKFEVSSAETQALLMGTNLYQDPALAIRELYQNALDACHYRLRRMRHAIGIDAPGWRPHIVFRIGEDGGNKFIECSDNGIGMSEHELRESFAKAGRRFRDLPEFIDEAAEWANDGHPAFEPISQFGIGVLSYFMVADRLEILTTRVDRRLVPQNPLRVTIEGGNALFRVSPCAVPQPPGGGSIVRLFLNEAANAIDLEKVLCSIVRAPTVSVQYNTRQWTPGELYDARGRRIPTHLTRMDLGVYFHNGRGGILVNGIPVNEVHDTTAFPSQQYAPTTSQGSEPLKGCTVSIGAWARPELSVDRLALLKFDGRAVARRLQSAAGELPREADIALNWVIDLSKTDLKAGNIAFERLKGRARRILASDLNGSAPLSSPAGAKSMELDIAAVGLYAGDPELLDGVNAKSYFGRLRATGLGISSDTTLHAAGFPPFDPRLLSLFAVCGDIPQRHAPARHRTDDARRALLGDRLMIDLLRIAESHNVVLGSAACFAWTCSFLEHPVRMTLTRESSTWSMKRNKSEWQAIQNLPVLRHVTVIERSNASAKVAAMHALWAGGDLEDIARRILPVFHLLPTFPKERRASIGALFDDLHSMTGPERRWDTESEEVWSFVESAVSDKPRDLSVHGYAITNNVPDGDLDHLLMTAISVDLDNHAPYYVTEVPLLSIAALATTTGTLVSVLIEKVSAAGFNVVPAPADPARLDHVLNRYPFVVVGGQLIGRYSRRRLQSLGDLKELSMSAGWSRITAALEELSTTDIAAGNELAIADLIRARSELLELDATSLPGQFDDMVVDLDVLIRFTDASGSTFGEALAALEHYRDIVSSWRIAALPDRILGMRPSRAVVELFRTKGGIVDSPQSWAVLAIRMSAIFGVALPDLVSELESLLGPAGPAVDRLSTLAIAVPRVATFDDLLIVSCSQFAGDRMRPDEVEAMSRPFAVDAAGLRAKVDAIYALGSMKVEFQS